MRITAEHQRLTEYRNHKANWKKWGPYLSERSWGTVREDYSADGSAWDYFPHDHARSRAYRWGEDGIAGISDRHQYICFALALWNGKDPILKERMFGLTGSEGNHGEDAKEYYFYLDSTPTHSYMKMLYKYPQTAYPYADLVSENRRRGFFDYEYELLDTGIFDGNRYFDVMIEYAKADQDDILGRITLVNRGPQTAGCVALPGLWFRNTWSWGYENGPMKDVPGKPHLKQIKGTSDLASVEINHPASGTYFLYAENADDMLFTENETNSARFDKSRKGNPHVKDAFHRYLVNGEKEAVNPAREGTKVAALYNGDIGPGMSRTIRLRLANTSQERPFAEFDTVFSQRLALPFTRKFNWTFESISNTLSTWKLKIKSNGHYQNQRPSSRSTAYSIQLIT